jgi:response regulator RpfG family c-di-GMP phosphodiesterase
MEDATRPRVLFVDDEPALQSVFARAFRRQFDIVTAGSVEAGIEALSTQGRFDYLVVDYAMHHRDGLEVATAARELQPNALRVLVTAHHALPEIQKALANKLVATVIAKPWTRAALLEQLPRLPAKPP